MKLRRHLDGTYSISEMTRADVENLSFGAVTAEAFQARYTGGNTGSFEARQQAMFNRLQRALNEIQYSFTLNESRTKLIKLVSSRIDNTDAYEKES